MDKQASTNTRLWSLLLQYMLVESVPRCLVIVCTKEIQRDDAWMKYMILVVFFNTLVSYVVGMSIR
jgi:uncharacterized membrane protein YecN with MAPEG domain